MTPFDQSAITLLDEVADALASIEGPVSAAVACHALDAVAAVIRTRRTRISLRTTDAIKGLVRAVRDEVAS